MVTDRRTLLRTALSTGAALLTDRWSRAAQLPSGPQIIDTHIHLFDPGRPGGVPWPEPGDAIYNPALPERYEKVVANLPVVGAIAIEASPLPQDNDWVLARIADHPIVVGMIGDLVPGSPTFDKELDRLRRNPLFLGIRYGNLWKRNLLLDMAKQGFMTGVKALATAGLVFETANPDASLLKAILAIAEAEPKLTIVIDHLPHAKEPTELEKRADYRKNLAELGGAPNVYAKLSEIVQIADGSPQLNASFYKDRLDSLWQTFGPAKLMYGSDWPNSDHLVSYKETLAVVRAYVAQKDKAAASRIFYENSRTAYRWKSRSRDQRSGSGA